MIYLVTTEQNLFENPEYKIISIEESLQLLNSCKVLQYDSETTGLDPHLCKILCVQFGNKSKGFQMVIDCSTIDIIKYKDILETKMLIGHNLKFDLQFLYNHNIIPRKIYDTMIVEQLLHLGFPYIPITPEEYEKYQYSFPYHIKKDKKYDSITYELSYALDALAKKYLDIEIDKTVRGQIIWRGLDTPVILYAAKDVEHLENIMWKQVAICKQLNCLRGAKLECDFTPVIAYLEWCGIKLDVEKWSVKMKSDLEKLNKAKKDLDNWFINLKPEDCAKTVSLKDRIYERIECHESQRHSQTFKAKQKDLLDQGYSLESVGTEYGQYVEFYNKPILYNVNLQKLQKKYIFIDTQWDLFEGLDLTPKVLLNWSSSKQVIPLAKLLGFNTVVQDKQTGEDKDSVLEKHLKAQKGINDKFLDLYFTYQEHAKVVSSFGQGHLDAINPITGRLYTTYKALGAASGRMSCGSSQNNEELEKLKKLPKGSCKYPNMQQLPHDPITRSCFISEKGNLFCSCDYSAQEGRMQAEVYNEPVLIDMYKKGLDSHSVNAKIFFKEELQDISVEDIKKLRPDLRQAAKAPFFALSYGGSYSTLMSSLQISEEEAKKIVSNYEEGYKATMQFAKKGESFVKQNGYILINPIYGHRLWWWDHKKWLSRQESFTPEFWESYRLYHKGTGDDIAQEVKTHFGAVSKYGRLARNAPSQGSSAIMTKLASIDLFNWIVDNNYFNKILLVNITHDEINTEFPEDLKDTYPKLVQDIMAKAGSELCSKVEVPAEAAVGDHWIH